MNDESTSHAESHPHEHHHTVGLALMAFSVVGIVLGSVMMLRGLGTDAFLDGPSALGIGLATFAVGLGLRRTGATAG